MIAIATGRDDSPTSATYSGDVSTSDNWTCTGTSGTAGASGTNHERERLSSFEKSILELHSNRTRLMIKSAKRINSKLNHKRLNDNSGSFWHIIHN